jgi:adenylate cyclase
MEITRMHQGNFSLALGHFDKALSLYDPEQHADDAFVQALSPGIALRCFAGWSLWFMGQPERARGRLAEAVALGRQLSEPHGLAHALVFAAVLHQLRRERPLARQFADEAIALAAEHGLIFYGAMARVVRGWALIGAGDDAHAAEEIREGMAGWHSTGAQLLRPHFLGLLAEACEAVADGDRGLAILDEALAVAESTGERCYQAELYRLRGERLLTDSREEADLRAAEACFELSRAIARDQEALSIELRAAMSLARLLRCRDSRASARDLVLPVYERFTEGFDTPDLRDARALLDQ